MGAQTLTSTASVAKVNLLPPEIAEKSKARRAQILMGATVVGAVGLVGVMYVTQSAKVSSAESEVAAANATSTKLAGDLAKLRNVSEIYAQRAAAEQALATAMERQILWSNYLNNLGLSIPDNVWLTELEAKQSLDERTGGPAGPAPAAANRSVFDTGLGTVTFKGVAFEYNDVAAWLESMARMKGWANAYATLAEEKVHGGRILVDFETSVTLTQASLSGQYTKAKPAGGTR